MDKILAQKEVSMPHSLHSQSCALCVNQSNGWCSIWNCAVENDVCSVCEYYETETTTIEQQLHEEA